eukprot:3593066-Prymnesium_polylepis.1
MHDLKLVHEDRHVVRRAQRDRERAQIVLVPPVVKGDRRVVVAMAQVPRRAHLVDPAVVQRRARVAHVVLRQCRRANRRTANHATPAVRAMR